MAKIEIRMMHDKINNRYWGEELIGEEWVKIDGTDMACEGNCQASINDYVKYRREEYYRVNTTQIGEIMEYELEVKTGR